MTSKAAEAQLVQEDGTYPTVPLRKDLIIASVVQTRVNGVDGSNPGPDIRRNLDYFLESIDIAQGNGPPSDLLLFHEFPITGFSEWTREQHYNLALEVPGPEIDEVAKKAQQYNCYIVFGTYAKDLEDWPGHILHLMVMVGPEGNVVARHWKQRNVRGLFPGGEMYTSYTTCMTVLSKCTALMRLFRSHGLTLVTLPCLLFSSNPNCLDAWP